MRKFMTTAAKGRGIIPHRAHVTDRRKFSLILEHEPTDAGHGHNRLRFWRKPKEAHCGFRCIRIPHVLTRFVHGSFANRGEKKSRGPDRYSLPNRHRWLHVLMKPDCRPSMRFTFLWILVRISCPRLRFTRSLILSLLRLSLFPSFSLVPHAERLLVVSSFLSYIVSCTWLPALRPARSLVLAAGNRQYG